MITWVKLKRSILRWFNNLMKRYPNDKPKAKALSKIYNYKSEAWLQSTLMKPSQKMSRLRLWKERSKKCNKTKKEQWTSLKSINLTKISLTVTI